jgi:hypothetical protein
MRTWSCVNNASSFSVVEGWHAPAGLSDLGTPASCPGQAEQPTAPGGCHETLDPGRQIVSQDSPNGVSRFGGQAATQAPDHTSRQINARESGPKAYLFTSSLPNLVRREITPVSG